MTHSNQVSILGSTGSVGESTLAVIDENPGYQVFALTANRNAKLLFEQCKKYQPVYAVLSEDRTTSSAQRWANQLNFNSLLLSTLRSRVAAIL